MVTMDNAALVVKAVVSVLVVVAGTTAGASGETETITVLL